MNADPVSRRILVVDDNPSIHDDFRRILTPSLNPDELDADAAALFGGEAGPASEPAGEFEVDSAHQGQEAREKVLAAREAGRPYALAFVDMRMPPGWDGLVTIGKLWEVDPEINVVICTAYSDHSWEEIRAALPVRERWLALRKPFDKIEVLQLAHALTEKWQLNRAASAHRAVLERKVEERTGELRHALQVKNQFLVNVTHALLTPTSGVIGMLQLLTDSPLARGDRENLDSALSAGEELLARLRQIQAFNEAEAGTLSVASVPLDLAAFADEVLASHSLRAARKRLRLESRIDPGLPRQVDAPAVPLHRILFALVDNAVNFTDEGAVTLEIRPAADRLEFVVADTGVGLSQEQQAWIAMPFAQVDGSRSRRGSGLGLGLALAKRLAASLGSELKLVSRFGGGTSVTFSVAFVTREDAAPALLEAVR